jgi:hypothetical protein
MAAYMLLFADHVEGLEVARFLIHRADGYIETEDDQKNLDDINADLRKQMELRLDMAKFTEITGLTIDDIFSGPKQKDCWLSAKQAKKVGLIHAIKRFTVPEQKAFNEKFVAFIPERGSDGPQGSGGKATDQPNINSQKPLKKMNRDELKAQHPDVYAAIHAEGMTQERERVQACMAYIDIDKDNVIAMIKDGKQINQAVMAEMQVKMFASAKITALGKDGKQTPPVKTGEASEKTEDEQEVQALEDQVMAGVKKINLF